MSSVTSPSFRSSVYFQGISVEDLKGIPGSMLESLKLIPEDIQATLLIRHAHRNEIPEGKVDNILLTDEGKKASFAFGTLLKKFQPGMLMSSTMGRCIETATQIKEGATWEDQKLKKDPFFAPSAPFIRDLPKAIEHYKRLGGPGLFNYQINNDPPLEGMRPTKEGVCEFLQRFLTIDHSPGKINVIVTHDAVLTVIVGFLLNIKEFDDTNWPQFLEGAFFWMDSRYLNVVWRGENHRLDKTLFFQGTSFE
ncbi:MAG: hypothetical protein K940chlam8_00002 [Chlamydiae bacterium]|nr:hypothetical protein [Chlamydiota bacterium]